jgi:uncharacterized phage protein (TIGR01671 family)
MDSDRFKFNAWDKKGKVMISWSCMRQSAFNRGDHQLFYSMFNNPDIDLLQCTGVKDRENKGIYEGDIIQINIGNSALINYVVEYEEGSFWLDSNIINFDVHTFTDRLEQIKKGLVVGNIYENPDIPTGVEV